MAKKEVDNWLQSMGLSRYAAAFEDNGYDEMEICVQISDEDLDAIGVADTGHRRLIAQSVSKMRQEGTTAIYFTVEPGENGKPISESGNGCSPRLARARCYCNDAPFRRNAQSPPSSAAEIGWLNRTHPGVDGQQLQTVFQQPFKGRRSWEHTCGAHVAGIPDGSELGEKARSNGVFDQPLFRPNEVQVRALTGDSTQPLLLPQRLSHSDRSPEDKKSHAGEKRSPFLKAVASFLFGKSRKNGKRPSAKVTLLPANMKDIERSSAGAEVIGGGSRASAASPALPPTARPHQGRQQRPLSGLVTSPLPRALTEDAGRGEPRLAHSTQRPASALVGACAHDALDHQSHFLRLQQSRSPPEQAGRRHAPTCARATGRPVSADVTGYPLRLPAGFLQPQRCCHGCGGDGSLAHHGCPGRSAAGAASPDGRSGLAQVPRFYTPQVPRRGLAGLYQPQSSAVHRSPAPRSTQRVPSMGCSALESPSQRRRGPEHATARSAVDSSRRDVVGVMMCDASTSYHSDINYRLDKPEGQISGEETGSAQ